jgi:hypothetical protein
MPNAEKCTKYVRQIWKTSDDFIETAEEEDED